MMEQISATDAFSVLVDRSGVVCGSLLLSSYVTSTGSTENLSPQYCEFGSTRKQRKNDDNSSADVTIAAVSRKLKLHTMHRLNLVNQS